MPDVEHHLISLDLTPLPICVHAYMMTTNSQRDVERLANRMMAFVEKEFGPGVPVIPALLDTILSTGIDTVRNGLGERLPEAKTTWEKATNFHLTMWAMPTDDPWHKTLMDLH